MAEQSTFDPNWFSPPGDTIADLLEEKAITLSDFSSRLGQDVDDSLRLLRGEMAIGKDLAERLSQALGASPTFWVNREESYRKAFSRLHSFPVCNELKRWVADIPLKEMADFGWVRKFDDLHHQIAECFRFFDVTSLQAWKSKYKRVVESAAYRTSPQYQSTSGALASWLRKGQILSEDIECDRWNPSGFENLLPSLRKLSRQRDPKEFLPKLQHLCASEGVAVVVAKAPKDCKASGATYFSSQKKAHIQLSCRYLSDDHFWFTFFHEAAHLLRHGQKSIFLEGVGTTSAQEDEANKFSEDILIPQNLKKQFLSLPRNAKDIIKFAKEAGISPGIVVGQLQHYKLLRIDYLNSLKRKYTWTSGMPCLNRDKL